MITTRDLHAAAVRQMKRVLDVSGSVNDAYHEPGTRKQLQSTAVWSKAGKLLCKRL